MAYATHLQQVLAYLKSGHPIQPPSGVALPESPPSTPKIINPVNTPQSTAAPQAGKMVRR